MPKELRIVYHFQDKISRKVRKKFGVCPGVIYGEQLEQLWGLSWNNVSIQKSPGWGNSQI